MAANRSHFYWVLLCLGLLTACQKDPVGPQAEDGEQFSGGEFLTTFDFSENAFGVQADGLSSDEQNLFVVGNSLFRRNWVTAPSSVMSLDGLGPVFNAISCGSCHFKDGRAAAPGAGEETLNGILFRLSVPGQDIHGGPLPDPIYGGQLQDKSILDALPEADVEIVYEEIMGSYPDGEVYSLRRPVFTFTDPQYGEFDPALLFSPRIAPQIPGLGLLENVPEATILAFADEFDADQDGVSGKPNYVWDAADEELRLGRFGWKATQPSVRQQTAGAFNGDMGLTTSVFPTDHLTQSQEQQLGELPNGGDPEVSDEQLDKVTFYTQTLSVPARRDYDEAQVLRGRDLFVELQCSACHVPKMTTGYDSPVNVLNGQEIRPYTDLLLHDMGPGLADNRPVFSANGSEWRTPPLWGIGMVRTVNDHTNFLHDGRARNIEEAVLWHGGEAEGALERFKSLDKSEREDLLSFLNSL